MLYYIINSVEVNRLEEKQNTVDLKQVFTLDLLILSILSRGDNYGYGIISTIEEETEGRMVLKQGILYPVLYKLNEEKYISSYDLKVDKRARVYYRIEGTGLVKLKEMKENFYINFKHIAEILEKGA